MKRILPALIFLFCSLYLSAQTPQHYYHIPGNVGVNNIFFNDGICQKFIFIYTQAELASMTSGVSGTTAFDSIYFRSNTSASMSITNLEITIGHTTFASPVPNFSANFNSGAPQIVLSVPLYTYTTLPGTWNVPADQWSGIPISAYTYNGTDNLAIQIRYTTCTYPDPFYAYNGGTPIIQYADDDTDTIASATTARPMFGFSSGILPPVALFNSVNHICPGTCTNFTNLSMNAASYVWTFIGANPSASTDTNPANICYNTPGSYAVSLIATNSIGSDTITLNNYITVYPYPAPQGISQSGDTLFANAGAVSYQWYYGGNLIAGATDYFYVAPSGGDYNVVCNDGNGCEVEAAIFDVVASIESAADNGSIRLEIFPNPVKETLEVRGHGLETVAVRIYNILGEVVLDFPTSNILHPTSIDVFQLPSGIYYLEVTSEEKIFRTKFLKQ